MRNIIDHGSLKELAHELKQAGTKVNLTNNPPYTEKNYPHDVLGVMDGGLFIVNQGLSGIEKHATLEELVTAYRQGYDNCVVTSDGTYATRKIVYGQNAGGV